MRMPDHILELMLRDWAEDIVWKFFEIINTYCSFFKKKKEKEKTAASPACSRPFHAQLDWVKGERNLDYHKSYY